eukprot:5665433-Amphidinium_carterae.1
MRPSCAWHRGSSRRSSTAWPELQADYKVPVDSLLSLTHQLILTVCQELHKVLVCLGHQHFEAKLLWLKAVQLGLGMKVKPLQKDDGYMALGK